VTCLTGHTGRRSAPATQRAKASGMLTASPSSFPERVTRLKQRIGKISQSTRLPDDIGLPD